MPEILYNTRSGRYVYADTKRFVPRAVIEHLIDTEQSQLDVRLKATTRLMAENKISLGEWQTRMAQSLKDAHLRMAALAAGGKDRLTPRHYGAVGAQLRKQYAYLDGYAQKLAAGQVTVKRALARSGSYASSIRPAFSRAEQITRSSDGFTEAKRSLDPQSRHCPSCLRHSTRGQWLAIGLVTSPGTDCECGQRCRCRIIYR